MQQKISKVSQLKRLFKHKLKPYIIDEKYRVVPAFSIGGMDYWYFDNTFEVPTGRMMAAMAIYGEMEMRCDREYLLMHTKAVQKVLSDPKKINIQVIAQLNINLQERMELAPLPDFIYKLASVIFFDKSEPVYSYDFDYNKKKIEKWKEAGGTLDFFLNTPLKTLVPSLILPEKDASIYLQVVKMIDETHRRLLSVTLSEEA